MKMILKRIVLTSLLGLFCLPAVAQQPDPVIDAEQPDPVRTKFLVDFPNLADTQLNPTPISNMYEVVASGRILYYFPDTSHLMFGALVDKEGTNLTQIRLIEELPLEKAVKIGNGPKKVIEITDPDCPYCRKASHFFDGKDELVTRYVFFFPLMEIHPDAAQKSAFVLSAKDRAAAYQDVMAGKYDKAPIPEFEDNKLLEDHLRLTQQVGVRSTPQFWIDGENVQGADIPELERLTIPEKTE
jgi:thiol:disulfide interchange protein DsbC